MNRILPIILLLALFCCNKPESKFEGAVKAHIISTIKTPDTYKPLSFSEPKKRLYCDVYKAPYEFFKRMCEQEPSVCDSADVAHYKNLMDKHANDSTVYNYQITHTFKYDNGLGSVITETKTFVIDTNFLVLGIAKEEFLKNH